MNYDSECDGDIDINDEGSYDVFAEQDVCVTNMDEWEMWDILRPIYLPNDMPRDVQLKCFEKSSEYEGKMGFHSFHVGELIEQLVEKTINVVKMEAEFVWEDYCEDAQETLIESILIHNPNFFTQINNTHPDLIHFEYDYMRDRFIIIAKTVDVALDVEYGFRQYINDHAFRWMWMYVTNLYFAQERLRQEMEYLNVKNETDYEHGTTVTPPPEVEECSPATFPMSIPKLQLDDKQNAIDVGIQTDSIIKKKEDKQKNDCWSRIRCAWNIIFDVN